MLVSSHRSYEIRSSTRKVLMINSFTRLSLLGVICSTSLLHAIPPQDGSSWEVMPTFSDEFNTFDRSKWHDTNPDWLGRQPGFFSPKNVAIENNELTLTARCEEPPTEELRKKGYHTFSTASVKHKELAHYGYYEIRAKAMKSRASSAFWFQRGDGKDNTEIDVFEICGGSPAEAKINYMTMHIVQRDGKKLHEKVANVYNAPEPLYEDYHIYGVDWNPKEVVFYVNDKMIHRVPNNRWHQPLNLLFDSETFPNWFGLPKPEELPSTFRIDYIRAWRRVTPPTFKGDFTSLKAWKTETVEGTTAQIVQTDKAITITTRPQTRDRIKIRTAQRFGYGTYTWKLFVPEMGVGDQASIGAFLYKDDKHEVDFEIGYGKRSVRTALKAKDDELVCYTTNQGHPYTSKHFTVKRNRAYTLTIRLMPAIRNTTFVVWEVDGKQVKSYHVDYACTPEMFYAYCSVENLTFLGDHIPTQANSARFTDFTFTPYDPIPDDLNRKPAIKKAPVKKPIKPRP